MFEGIGIKNLVLMYF